MRKDAARIKGSSRRGSSAVVEKGSSTNPAHERSPARRLRKRWIALGTLACAAAVMVIGWTVGQHMGRAGENVARASAVSNSPVRAVHTEREMSELVALLSQTLPVSRAVLLGSRDPHGPSCVTVVRHGDIQTTLPTQQGDADGGPGTRLASVYSIDREHFTSPLQDYAWHQGRLRTLLQNEIILNRPALELSHRLAERTRDLAAAADAWTTWPVGLEPEGFDHQENCASGRATAPAGCRCVRRATTFPPTA